MLKNLTTIVLGAGASAEIGMPLGVKLAETIAESLYFEFDFDRLKKGDDRIYWCLKSAFVDPEILNLHLKACRHIHDGVLQWRSIDNYIDAHKSDKEVQTVAKIAIAENILRSERALNLIQKDRSRNGSATNTQVLGQTWYDEFFSILFRGVTREELKRAFEILVVISFNYDRCFQQAAILWMMSAYHLSYDEGLSALSNLKILYPYGTVCTRTVIT